MSSSPLQAVVEIIMLERMLDGVIKGEYSLGWALLPLFRVGMGMALWRGSGKWM